MPSTKSALNLWEVVVVVGKAATAIAVGGRIGASKWAILLRADHGDYAISKEKDDVSHQLHMCWVLGTLPHTLNSFFESS